MEKMSLTAVRGLVSCVSGRIFLVSLGTKTWGRGHHTLIGTSAENIGQVDECWDEEQRQSTVPSRRTPFERRDGGGGVLLRLCIKGIMVEMVEVPESKRMRLSEFKGRWAGLFHHQQAGFRSSFG
jgi:hypothetical protein